MMTNIEGTATSESGSATGVKIGSIVGEAAPVTEDGGDGERSTLFVSHSSRDAELADAIVKLLQDALGLAPAQLFSSSTDGYGIPPGRHFGEYIRATLHETRVVVYLISPSFLASRWCLVEMGATWVADDAVRRLPVLVPPTTPSDLDGLDGVMREIQAISLDGIDAIGQVVDAVADDLPDARMQTNTVRHATETAWAAIDAIITLR